MFEIKFVGKPKSLGLGWVGLALLVSQVKFKLKLELRSRF